MTCPVCNTTLVMSERQGIEIDHCPQCRGIWLDRGELDKIIERSAAFEQPRESVREPERRYEAPQAQGPRYEEPRKYEHPSYGHSDHHKRKKRGGFLEDLFDFGD